MTPSRRTHQLNLLLALAVLLTACSQVGPTSAPIVRPQAASYAGQDIGTLGGSSSDTRDVSDDGKVAVGNSDLAENSQTHAFLWTETGGMRDLGMLGGPHPYSSAQGVSNDGQTVVGHSTTPRGTNAFLWTESTGMRDLGTLGGYGSGAEDVSADSRTVVGSSTVVGDRGQHAFLWTEEGGMRDLGTLGGPHSYALGVSGDGQTVVGYSLLANYSTHAFIWTEEGGMKDLGTLGGGFSAATGISADGKIVVGSSGIAGSGQQRAFIWTKEGGMRSLGTLGGSYSGAQGISADGRTVVGVSSTVDDFYAFVWTEDGGMRKLEVSSSSRSFEEAKGARSLSTLSTGAGSAQGANDDGTTVVGSYTDNSGNMRAVRWTVSATSTPRRVTDKYLINFEKTPANQLIYSVKLGSGVVHREGSHPTSKAIPVSGKRRLDGRIVDGHQAKVISLYGSKRLTVVRAGTNTPNAQGGRIRLSFAPSLNPAGVTLTSMTLSNLTAKGAHLTFYYTDGSSARRTLGTTARGGSLVVPLDIKRLKAVEIFAPTAFAVDNVAFTSHTVVN